MSSKFYQLAIIIIALSVLPLGQSFAYEEEETYGKFGGFGFIIELGEGKKFPHVKKVFKNTPSDRAGIEVGDVVTHVDEESLEGRSFAAVLGFTRGKPGTTAELTIVRAGSEEPKKFNMTREVIKKQSSKKYFQNQDYIWLIILLISLAIIVNIKVKNSSGGKKE